jgi:twitching motility protein PilT
VSSVNASKVDIKYLLKALLKYNATDLHLKVGRTPIYRINGKLVPAKMTELSMQTMQQLLFSVMTEQKIAELKEKKQVDLSFYVDEVGRFRGNIYFQRGSMCAAIRMVPLTPPSLDELGLPSIVKDLCLRPRGLLLVAGPAGSGKSMTISSMLNYINENSPVQILTIEETIECVYRDLKASVMQREVGIDIQSVQEGLAVATRQDADVIMVTSLSDANTIQMALRAAETGHLVISTVPATDSKTAIERIINTFPLETRNQVRIQFAGALVGIVSQQLVIRADASSRALACEVLVKSPAIESHILNNQIEKIPAAMAVSSPYYRMQTLDQSLEKLVMDRVVKVEEAIKSANNPDLLKSKLSGSGQDVAIRRAG